MRSLRLFLFSRLPVAVDERGTLAGLPGLARILSRARIATFADTDLESVLLDSFGVQRQRDWPVAPFSWLGDGGEAGARYWLRADPVHLRAERDAVLLVDARHFTLDAESASALLDALNNHFESDGLRFFASAPARWYVAVDRVPEIATSPLRAVAGRNIDTLLPKGTDALTWHRWFNEIQMLFHSHGVNEAREGTGLPTVNSVWFWGGGVLPGALSRAFAGVWSDDPLARGLALASRVALAPLPNSAEQWLVHANLGEHVVVLNPVSAGGDDPLEDLERNWFAPLLGALRGRQLSVLSLLVGSGEGTLRFDLSAGDLWKFWRRAPALAQ
jgi:hypothetical protein